MKNTVQRDEDEQIETIHVYMLREPLPEDDEPEPRWPIWSWPSLTWESVQQWITASIAFVMLAGFTVAPAGGPAFVIKTLRIPLVALPPQVFTASANIVPTGVQQYPAVQARGKLTVYNGSFLTQQLPAGFIVTTPGGNEIITDQAVTIPAANPPTLGSAVVAAHAVVAGSQGNIASYAISQQDGADITIKNLAAFTGGQDAYTKTYATDQDVNNATAEARQQVEAHPTTGLHLKPCTETVSQDATSVSVTRTCQAFIYTLPKGLSILSISVSGNAVIVAYKAFRESAHA